MIRVLVADAAADDRDETTRFLAAEADIDVVASVGDSRSAIEAAQGLGPDVILLDASLPGVGRDRLMQDLVQVAPASAIIVVSGKADADTMRQAMRSGAQDFLPKPLKPDEVLVSIRQVYEASAPRRAILAGAVTPTSEQPSLGKIICMFSPKGGVGRTTIGVNLAIALHRLSGKRVAIADCNLQFGDVGIVMNTSATKTIADLIPTISDLSEQVLQSVLVRHESGVDVLLAPTRPEVAELFHPEHVKQILQALARTHQYVIVDTWTTFQEVILGIFDVSSEIVLLTTLDMPAVKNIRVFLDVCDAIQYPKNRVLLVINRADASSGLRIQDIEESIQHKVAATIVSGGPLVTSSINRGIPFILTDPEAQISENVMDLARLLLRPEDQNAAPEPQPVEAEPKRRQGLGRLIQGR